jgi:O-antigen ligase
MGVLAETGIIGIVAYSFWFLGIWKLFSKSLKVIRNGFNVPLVAALSTFILLSTVSDVVHAGSFENGHSLLVGVLMGVLREYDLKFNRSQAKPMSNYYRLRHPRKVLI